MESEDGGLWYDPERHSGEKWVLRVGFWVSAEVGSCRHCSGILLSLSDPLQDLKRIEQGDVGWRPNDRELMVPEPPKAPPKGGKAGNPRRKPPSTMDESARPVTPQKESHELGVLITELAPAASPAVSPTPALGDTVDASLPRGR